MNFVDLVLNAVAAHEACALGWSEDAGDHGEQRGLTGSIGAEQSKDGLVLNNKIEPIHGQFSRVISLGEILHNQRIVIILLNGLDMLHF
jgi:hypothetical protein